MEKHSSTEEREVMNDRPRTLPPPRHRVPWGRHVENLPGTAAAVAAAREVQGKLRGPEQSRSFIKVMTPSSSYNVLSFPVEFTRKYMPFGTQTVTVIDQNGKHWPVNWTSKSPVRHYSGFSSKWRPFCAHHRLSRGDVCLVVLTNPKRIIFSVTIFKRRLYLDQGGNEGNQSGAAAGAHRRDIEWGSSEGEGNDDFVVEISADEEASMDADDHDRYRLQPAEDDDTDRELEDLEEEMSDSEPQIKVRLEIAPSVKSGEEMGIKLVTHKEKAQLLEKLLLGSPGTTIQKTRSGGLTASVKKPMLRSILKMALPLREAVHFY